MKYYLSFIAIMFVNLTFSHSGRTDKNGGHYDRINGGYHYHGKHSHKKQNSYSYDYHPTYRSNPRYNSNNSKVLAKNVFKKNISWVCKIPYALRLIIVILFPVSLVTNVAKLFVSIYDSRPFKDLDYENDVWKHKHYLVKSFTTLLFLIIQALIVVIFLLAPFKLC